jgi:hypothetical protein
MAAYKFKIPQTDKINYVRIVRENPNAKVIQIEDSWAGDPSVLMLFRESWLGKVEKANFMMPSFFNDKKLGHQIGWAETSRGMIGWRGWWINSDQVEETLSALKPALEWKEREIKVLAISSPLDFPKKDPSDQDQDRITYYYHASKANLPECGSYCPEEK